MLEQDLVLFCKGLVAVGAGDYVDWVLDEYRYWLNEGFEEEISFPEYLVEEACPEGFREVMVHLLKDSAQDVPDLIVKNYYLEDHTPRQLANLLIAAGRNWKLEVYFNREVRWEQDFKRYSESEFRKFILEQLIRDHIPWKIACPYLDKSLYFRDLCELEVYANDFYDGLAQDRADGVF